MFWFAQILALLICVVSSISYLSKRKDRYLAEQLLVNVLYCLQYIILGAFSGAISNVTSLVKYIVFYINAKNNKKNPRWQVVFFCLISVILGCFALNEWYTIIPIITSVIFTFAIWQDNPIVLRTVVIICSILWVIFNITVGAYVSAIYSGVELVFAFVTMIKLLVGRKNHELSDY